MIPLNLTDLFEDDITLNHTDFKLFKSCNDAAREWSMKQDFYKLKNKMLKKYATEDGYDKQIITIKCRTCRGAGMYSSDDVCHDCNNGVFEKRQYYLQRYLLNGYLFYTPIYSATEFHRPKNTIEGYVQHHPPDIYPPFAYFCLLKKYDQDGFNQHLLRFQQNLNKDQWRKWGYIAANSANFVEALAKWYGVISYTPEVIDDLPF